MKMRKRVRDFLLLLALAFMTVAVFWAFGSSLFTTDVPSHINQLDSGWSVKFGEKEYEDVSFTNFNISTRNRGDVISFSRVIPKSNINSPMIMFKSKYDVVDVYIDGQKVYTFGMDYYQKGKLVPKKYNKVYIGDNKSDTRIEIVLTASEDNLNKGYTPILYGTNREITGFFLQYHRLPMFIGGFFIVYSYIQVSLGLYLFLTGRKSKSVFVTAAMSIVFGLHCYAYNDIFCFMSDKDGVFTSVEYLAMFFMPHVVVVLIRSTHPEIAPKRQNFLWWVNMIMPTAFAIAHYTDFIHFTHFAIPFQVFVVVENFILIPPLIKGLKADYVNRRKSDVNIETGANNYLVLGYVVLLLSVFLEIVNFNITNFNTGSNATNFFARSSILDFGMLGFIMCIFVYYFLGGIEHMTSNMVKKELEGLAYTDSMTGLMNRAKCSQYTALLKVPYGLVNLDLDRLKKVNDTYGHLEGDKMIKEFAALLTRSFQGASLIGRTGGDEFMVIFENPKEGVCERCIEILQQNMQRFNENAGEDCKFTLSASAGFAYSSEITEKDFKYAYYLADTRMYEMKEAHHA